MKYFKKHGGEKIWELLDFNSDDVVDQAELISYLMFVMCIEDCEVEKNQDSSCDFSADEKSRFNEKYQTKEAVCHVLEAFKLVSGQKEKAKSEVKVS